ncbi:hypothetical protein BDZ94DRAFT_1315566, partial [Collybia nuda]
MPIAENRPNPANGPPHHFLISGLSQQAHDHLVNTRVIATKMTIILTLPFTQPLPEYIGTLKNFSLGESDHDKKIVAEAVQAALATNPGITVFVNGHLSQINHGTMLTTQTLIQIETLRVRTSKTANKKILEQAECVAQTTEESTNNSTAQAASPATTPLDYAPSWTSRKTHSTPRSLEGKGLFPDEGWLGPAQRQKTPVYTTNTPYTQKATEAAEEDKTEVDADI